ncbi:MAG TPA: ATP-binding protein [Gammaproteobacteria bacterium]|nr:ATP-binding protein [Gammaproteobacteria bacterium]
MKPLWLSWSSGKDSAWTLHALRTAGEYHVTALVTTLNTAFDRVAMHAVRRDLLERQAQALGVPLRIVPLPWPCSNDQYEAAMSALLAEARAAGVAHMAFGDLFLRDIRAYRERLLANTGVTPVFPLWDCDTRALAREMVDAGLRATVTCVDLGRLPAAFAGRTFDHVFLDELPPDVDPCGENGEFHTFCWAGPMFRRPLAIRVGTRLERDGFAWADLLPAG